MTNNTSLVRDTHALTRILGLFLLPCCLLFQEQAFAVEPTVVGQYDKPSSGYLKVFSVTQESQWGEGSYYYLHTGYRIYDSNGKAIKWIENHDSNIDEDPQKVELAPGAYTVRAQSDRDGYVKVQVVIKPAQTTAIHLEREHDKIK